MYSILSEFICKPISLAVSSIWCSLVFTSIILLDIIAISSYKYIGNVYGRLYIDLTFCKSEAGK